MSHLHFCLTVTALQNTMRTANEIKTRKSIVGSNVSLRLWRFGRIICDNSLRECFRVESFQEKCSREAAFREHSSVYLYHSDAFSPVESMSRMYCEFQNIFEFNYINVLVIIGRCNRYSSYLFSFFYEFTILANSSCADADRKKAFTHKQSNECFVCIETVNIHKHNTYSSLEFWKKNMEEKRQINLFKRETKNRYSCWMHRTMPQTLKPQINETFLINTS